MTTQRIYTGGHDEVTLVCKECGGHKSIPVSSIKEYWKAYRVKCGCGFVFKVVFEPRITYRKMTDLFGVCFRSGSGDILSEVTITNLSKTGVGFILESTTIREGDVKEGDVLKLQFTLGGKVPSLIKARVIVRFLEGRNIGAEFFLPDMHTLKTIGFYLLP